MLKTVLMQQHASILTADSVDEASVREYQEHGITCLRGVFDADTVERFRNAVDRAIRGEHDTVLDYGSGRKFVNGLFLWTWDEEIRELICDTHLPAIAARLTDSRKVNLFYDQLFVKEPGTTSYPTPWHNDQPYWPVKGWQVVSFWIALDPVTEESGAVKFIRGSHRWERRFQPESFSGPNRYALNPDFEPASNIQPERHSDDIVYYDLQPGDVTAHHGLTVHAAGGNATATTRRRGYSIRYTGDDVVYDPHPGTPNEFPDPGLAPGAALDCDLYPVVYRA